MLEEIDTSQINKQPTLILILLIFTACGTPQKSVTWKHSNFNANQFEIDKVSCEAYGRNAAGSSPTYQPIPICSSYQRGRRRALPDSSCENAKIYIIRLNNKAKQFWEEDYESGFNSCMFEKGYKL